MIRDYIQAATVGPEFVALLCAVLGVLGFAAWVEWKRGHHGRVFAIYATWTFVTCLAVYWRLG